MSLHTPGLILAALLVRPEQWPGVSVIDKPVLVQEMLREHNLVRQRYRVQPLHWSLSLEKEAQGWAEFLLANDEFRVERTSRHGQNLFDITGGVASPRRVVTAWADEGRFYRSSSNTCSARCGHFTQLVWRESRELGCAAVHNAHREIWVCDYSPPGNIIGERPY